MVDSYLVYLGLALFFTGLVSLIWPLRFLYIRTRYAALAVAGVGMLLAVGTLLLPYSEKEAIIHTTKLDDWMPRWQVGERHTIHVAATPEKVFAAFAEARWVGR